MSDQGDAPEPDVAPVRPGLTPPLGWEGTQAPPENKYVRAARERFDALLERRRHHLLVDLGLRLYERDRESAGTLVGSALAFRLFLFFAPLVLFAVGLAGFVGRVVDEDDVHSAGVTGSLAAQIETALEQPNATRWVAIGVGAFGMAWAGRSLSRVMVAASCLSWRQPVRIKASPRLIGALVGLLFGMALISTIINRLRADLGLAVGAASFAIVFCCYVVAWVLLSQLLPKPTHDPGVLLPGACVVALVLSGLQAVSQLVLPDQFDRASDLYGAIGTTLVTLGWFFIVGRAAVLSMSLDAVIYERLGSITAFVFSLPLLRKLPARWRWLRRYFDLETPPDSSS